MVQSSLQCTVYSVLRPRESINKSCTDFRIDFFGRQIENHDEMFVYNQRNSDVRLCLSSARNEVNVRSQCEKSLFTEYLLCTYRLQSDMQPSDPITLLLTLTPRSMEVTSSPSTLGNLDILTPFAF